jgi:hypothetical protein
LALDIDRIAKRIATSRTDVDFWQLTVTHEADDDGVWWFRRRGAVSRVQLDSSTGNRPFEIGADHCDTTHSANTVDEAVSRILSLLDLDDSRPPKRG